LTVFGFGCTASAQAPTIGGSCTVFPADDIWNTPVDQLPVAANSSTYVNTIGAATGVHADFGAGIWDGGPIGIPFITVLGSQTKYPATFLYADESDQGPYAVPLNVPIEGGSASTGDRHAIAVDTNNCILYELYRAFPQSSSWQADSGAIFNLLQSILRPSGWTSADAAGLPIFPGLFRYDEIAAGEIRHALRFTVPQTRRAFVWPARHYASSLTGTQYPPMGVRFRLRASFDISGFSPTNQIILRALKKYGMILADNGSAWYLSGAPDSRWNDSDLHNLGAVHGSDFEVVDVSGLMISPDSSQARQSSAVSVTVTPSSANLQVSTTKQFSATVNNSTNQGVTWTASAGIISAAGLYTAPASVPSPPTVTIQATSQADTFAKGTASVTITAPPPPVTVTVSPSSASVQVSTTKQFSATVNNSSNQSVTWTVTGGGTINSGGLYTAPASVPSGAVTVQGTSVASPTATGSASVTVTNPPPPVTVAVSPASASVQVSTTKQFTATVNNSGNQSVVWSVTGGGSIDSSGLYTAPASVPPGAVTVQATSVASPTATGSASVTVTNPSLPVSVTISPTSAEVRINRSRAFTATVQNATNKSVIWQVGGITGGNSTVGTISSQGTYTAPKSVPAGGTVQVSAVSVADSTKSASALITIVRR